jgi:hypothetical protein
MHMSGRELASFLGISPRTIGRLELDGVLEREADGMFHLRKSVRRLFTHYKVRHDWAFAQLRRYRIFNESWGDVFKPPHRG